MVPAHEQVRTAFDFLLSRGYTFVAEHGYFFLSRGASARAVEVFALNVRAFPRSANVYHSLGKHNSRAATRRSPLHATEGHCSSIPGTATRATS